MKPELNSRRIFGITRSKGKMYEFGLPLESHIAVPEGSHPEELFLLAVGTLGDAAVEVCSSDDQRHEFHADTNDELRFSASFFDAFLASRFLPSLNREISLLASATYYLANRPGSSRVLSTKISSDERETSFDKVARWLLQTKWEEVPEGLEAPHGDLLGRLMILVARHFHDGSGVDEIMAACRELRAHAYRNASHQDLFLADVICAITKRRMSFSSWANLPTLSGIPSNAWSQIILRNSFPKELWPSQILIGKAGMFSGASGLIQMPTSAGKTKSVEILIRSSFMSGRARLAVVIAPFRALCHEISNSLRETFLHDDVSVNELSDALQRDYLDQIAQLLGMEIDDSKHILVLTPEKLLYILRQTPGLVDRVGIVVYDEGHQFDAGSRGVTYELLLTEIKRLLPATAQTILISAVIQNAQAIGDWLIGENAKIVSGSDLSPTARSVAFASWAEKLGQLMFYETKIFQAPDYFVPRVIEQQKLERVGRESKARAFPERNDAKDVSLYIGLRLIENGAVAIFCGRKDTASSFTSRAVDIYARGFNLPPPANYSDSNEMQRLENLYRLHFGESADSTKAAKLGVYCHHGNTPRGIRLSIEHAMQQEKIRFVVCTSTLAQGVNLPIRYLIVSGVYQGSQRIKVRDFHNLMGRAGRAGMHTEGLVIFADPEIYDNRVRENWRFRIASDLLNPERTEPISSSLLSIFSPMQSPAGVSFTTDAERLCTLLLQDEEAWRLWAQSVIAENPALGFDVPQLVAELLSRRRLIYSIESYLMANRGAENFEEYLQRVMQLATETLAYSLADEGQKSALVRLFNTVAQYIKGCDVEPTKQAKYAKTLLGVDAARRIEAWTSEERNHLISLTSNEDLLHAIWAVLVEHSQDKFIAGVLPQALPLELTMMWLQGRSYEELFAHAITAGGTRPWGKKRRELKENDIIEFCENTLGFEWPLIIAAVMQFLFEDQTQHENAAAPLLLFQKALKYGIPDVLAISCYEIGFADRMLAQVLRNLVLTNGYAGQSFALAIEPNRERLATTLLGYPSYFESVFKTVA